MTTLYIVMKSITEISADGEYHTENIFTECAFLVEAEAKGYVKAAREKASAGVMYCYEECELHGEVPA